AQDDVRETRKPVIVTICGSMRFVDLMWRVACDETLKGHIVHMPFVVPAAVTPQQKAQLDELHKRKIDMAGDVLIVSDETGYVGESTLNEIDYARRHGHEVIYWRVC